MASAGRADSSAIRYSWVMKFGIATSSWIEAAVRSGPRKLCDTSAEWYDSASAAILRQPVIPPAIPRSGRTYWGPPASSRSRNSQIVLIRSPFATGLTVRLAICAWRTIESIWIGSS